jgi:hypothetical protein
MSDDTIIPTTDEVVAAVGGFDKMRELVKTVLLYAADDVISNLREPSSDGSGPHDHIEDDCGDYMHAAMKLATELHEAWFSGGEHSTATQLVMWARDDDMADTDEVRGMDLSDLRMNHAGDGICPALDDAVKAVRDKCLHLSIEDVL